MQLSLSSTYANVSCRPRNYFIPSVKCLDSLLFPSPLRVCPFLPSLMNLKRCNQEAPDTGTPAGWRREQAGMLARYIFASQETRTIASRTHLRSPAR